MPVTMSTSDIAAYAGFWSWFEPAQEVRSDAFRVLGYDNAQAIEREVYALKRVKAIDLLDTTVGMKVVMLADVRKRGAVNPEPVDETAFFKGAVARTRSGFGTALEPYKPEPGASGIKLKPAAAVRFFYAQESYSDDSRVAIPFEMDINKPCDFVVFARNVSALVRRADTHNGMAGSGCNFSASVDVANQVVIVHCRASIAD